MEKDMNNLEYLQSKENYDSWKLLVGKAGLTRFYPTLKGRWKEDKDKWNLIMYDEWSERRNSLLPNKNTHKYTGNTKTFKANNGGVCGWWNLDLTELGHSVEPSDMIEDPIVNSVISQFEERSKAGIKKYGTTLKDNNTDDFFQHLKEELMDAILYLEKLQQEKKDLMNAIIENIDKQEYRYGKGY
jgi:hypothetical protein